MTFDAKLFSGIGVFAAVVDTGNFARAGTALGITGSGVSRAIARLEKRLGARLLERSPRAVALTDEGRRFHVRIKPMLEEAEAAAAEIDSRQSMLTGRLRISTDAPAASLVLAAMLPSFREAHPQLVLELVVRDSLGDLVADGFDLAVRFGDTDATGLRSTVLARTRILTVASPALFKAGMPHRPSDLESLPCLLMRDPITQAAYAWRFISDAGKQEIKPRAGIILNDGSALMAACRAGAGVAQVLEIEAAEDLRAGRLVCLFADLHDEDYPCHLYTRPGSITSRRIAAFAAQARAHCAHLAQSGRLLPA